MNVAFIPVRGGSKSIPLKNIKEICGKPLLFWTIKAACECKFIDKVYVATDSDKIGQIARNLECENSDKICVISRSEESATDTASTEFAMLEFATNYEFENIVLIQATSPLLRASDLDKGFEKFTQNGVDSVLSAVRQKRFIWQEGVTATPQNYDPNNRPRRQDFSGYFVENGAFYITSKSNLIASKNRISGNIQICEMDEESFFEIDEPSDWIIIENLLQNRLNAEFKAKFNPQKIKAFFSDCDGCLTDAGMYYSEFGDELKKFNTRDGMAFKLLREMGIITGIITGEKVALNRRRAEKLKLDIFIEGCDDKLSAIKQICATHNIKMDEILYIGDDINDIEVLQNVGVSCCPNNANEKVKNYAKIITSAKGGEGVIREIFDKFWG